MKLAILKIILWPKDSTKDARVIVFEPGKINILSGESGSGKSALTAIVDYCLGSEKCSIPVGLIRQVTGWFGLHIKLANTELIIARRNPEDQQTTTDFFWTEGIELSVPSAVEKNARVEDLKSRFNQIARLSTLDFSTSDTAGFAGRASFRDMAAFNFQPQHVVANPYTFFYKADTTEHREKLRIIFPFVLGAINAQDLVKQRELKDVEREHDRLQRELDARLNAARAWEAEVESYFLQAKALGLLPDSTPPGTDWTLDKYVLELQRVPERVRSLDLPDMQPGTSELAVSELTKLVDEEDELSQEIGSTRRRLSKLDQLASSVDQYSVTLTSQQDRMIGVGWLHEKLSDSRKCPICSTIQPTDNPAIVSLGNLAKELGALSVAIHEAPAKLDNELLELRQELREQESAITKIRQKRRYLEDQSSEAAAKRQRVRQIYLFVGRVEQALDNLRTSQNVEELRQRVLDLMTKIRSLREELDPRVQRNRLLASIDSVSTGVARYAGMLNLEHATENVKLNIKELTLQFHPLSGRTDFLWELGSGQNWVGYHVAGMLALHEHFLSLIHSPVPNFMMLDQPSQVYFPEAWPSLEDSPDGDPEISADISGVRRIFQTLAEFLRNVNDDFQFIVTEHAGSITWEGISNVHVVGNWREGHDDFLVPRDWQKNSNS